MPIITIDTILAALPEELAAVMPAQIDAWLDQDMAPDEITVRLLAIWEESLSEMQDIAG